MLRFFIIFFLQCGPMRQGGIGGFGVMAGSLVLSGSTALEALKPNRL